MDLILHRQFSFAEVAGNFGVGLASTNQGVDCALGAGKTSEVQFFFGRRLARISIRKSGAAKLSFPGSTGVMIPVEVGVSRIFRSPLAST